MSASEKLRALALDGFTCEHWTDYDASDLAVTDELIAVVEAAETVAPIMLVALRDSGMNATPGHMLGVALAALDEALT